MESLLRRPTRPFRCYLSRNDEQYLRSRNRRHPVHQRDIVDPARHDADAGGAAADCDLAFPPREVAPNAGESLAASRIAKAARALNQRGLQRCGIAPALTKPPALSWLQ